DAVSVRLALARGGDALEDSVQIVSGAPSRRGVQLPVQEPEAGSPSEIVAAPPTQPATQPEPPSEVELNGIGGTAQGSDRMVQEPERALDEPADRRLRGVVPVIDDGDSGRPLDAAGWNAFAASSYPEAEAEVAAEQPIETKPPRPLGRHSRAVAREQVPLSMRVGQVASVASAAVRSATGGVAARVRQGVGRIGSAGPDNRLLAGIAGIGLIFVVALIIGHSSSRPATPTATRPAATSAQPQTHPSAAAQSSAAAATNAAPVPPHIQTFGAGDTGFQVIRLRYGAQAGYMRVVFDLGAASASAAGTPKVTVSFSTPTTMLVTLNGTLPAGSIGTPTPGKVISSVRLVSSSGDKTVYRFSLTRAATATAFYLASPTRFVLDIH
ncbi:MAG: hypothetical protein M3Z57_04460, partial [Candidatus Dormibacteraeota bacterium]|nr:hypothetical protein [Candidatus Dormibacteraeota bacterium]